MQYTNTDGEQVQVARNIVAIILLLTVVAASAVSSEDEMSCGSDSSSPGIVGVWKLIEASTTFPDGEVEYPFGSPAAGLFVYTPGGHLSLHLHRNPPPDRFTERPSDGELGAVARGYIGYYGRWSISGDKVTHHIAGAMLPNRFGQNAERPYVLCGDVLQLTIEGRDGRVFYRRLERVESFSE